MDNNIIDKRTMWESMYDKLKLETDQNKELVKAIFTNLQSSNESLVKANKELLEALKEITKEYDYALNIIAEAGGFPFNADQNNLLISTKEAIKKHSPIN